MRICAHWRMLGGAQVAEDPEIQAFWKDLRENGHPDKTEGWFELTDIASLTEALTIIAWTASAHHAAVNFGVHPEAIFLSVLLCSVLDANQ